MATLDAELYRNLIYVLNYRGDVAELGLHWSVAELNPATGVVIERDLVRNGRNIPVTKADRTTYVYAMANYKLNVSIRRQCKAFTAGFCE